MDTHKCVITGISAEGERNIDAIFVIFISLIFFFLSTISKLLHLSSHTVVVHLRHTVALSISNPTLSSSLWKTRIRGFAVVHLPHRKDPCPCKDCFQLPGCYAIASPPSLSSALFHVSKQGPLETYFSLCVEQHGLMSSSGHARML